MRLSVDIGFGFTKAVSETGKEVKFPSVVGRKYGSTLSGVLGGVQEDYQITLSYEDEPKENESYYVGDAAMTAGGSRTWEENAAKNRNLIVLVSTAVAVLMDQDEPIDLAVGLPMSYFNNQRKSIREALQTLDVICTLNGKKKRIHIRSVFVFPQSAGVYYSALHNLDGSVKDANLFNRPVAVIDVGYRTVDLLYMTRAKTGLVPREDLSGSEDLGMNEAHKVVQLDTSTLIKGTADLNEVEKAILWFQGELQYRGQTFNLTHLKEKAYRNHAERIKAWVKQKWGDDMNNLAAVIIGGGGGEALFTHFDGEFPGLLKVEKPEFANARGYLAAQAIKLKLQTAQR